MPAPTALQRSPEQLATEATIHDAPDTAVEEDEGVVLPTTSTTLEGTTSSTSADVSTDMQLDSVDVDSGPLFKPENAQNIAFRPESRKVPIPPHRMTPLKNSWPKIYTPLVEHLGLQVRMNVRSKAVELRSSTHTKSTGALQQGADFVHSFALGFDVDDAVALLRLDDLYIQSFEVKDVKSLEGQHLSRAIGRVAGANGKTKHSIENATRTRIVLADSKIHILGGFKNITMAREAVVSLILGSPPGKVYGNLRTVAARMKERF